MKSPIFAHPIAALTLRLVQLPRSGQGYYSYEPGNQQFGTAGTIQTILQIARTFYYNMPEVQLGIGDISLIHGGSMRPAHMSHTSGLNVDIRPLRIDHKHSPCNYHESGYDRGLTQLLVSSFLAHRNVARILFNDPQIRGVSPFRGHDNHLHVVMNK